LVARAVGIPIRGITLFLFGGVAEMEDEPPSAWSEFLMAIAGPAVSAVMAGVFWILSRVADAPSIVVPLQYLAWINLAVLLFNLVPAFPLDGGRVLRSALWGMLGNLRRATYIASLCGQAFAWLLIAVGISNFVAGQIFYGLWLGLIGLFLNGAARSSYQQVVVRQMFRGERVSRFMNPRPIVVRPSLDLKSWVEEYVLRYHHKLFPVAANGAIEGVIATQALASFPREEWAKHSVGEAMRRDVQSLSTSAETDALKALGKMQRTGSSRLLVMDGDSLVGIVSLKDLLSFFDLKLELENLKH
jgi:CBS domain-containing protein